MNEGSFEYRRKQRQRYVRWQGRTITQLGYTCNLLLTFNVVALGYDLNLLRDATFSSHNSAKVIWLLGFVGLSISLMLGSVALVTRLLDIRFTAQRVRNGDRFPTKSLTDALGRWTWRLVWVHALTLLVGSILLGTVVLVLFGSKLLTC